MRRIRQRVVRSATAALVLVSVTVVTASAASASSIRIRQSSPVHVSPSASGMPGAAFLQQALGWLSQLALWGSLASILVGAALYGLSQNSGNYNGAYRGKQLAAAGAIGACLAGLAPTAVNMLFGAAS